MLTVWENDWGPCGDGHGEPYTAFDWFNGTFWSIAVFTGLGAATCGASVLDPTYIVSCLLFAPVAADALYATNNDDFVGKLEPRRKDCWETSDGPADWRITGVDGVQTGSAEIDVLTANRSPLCLDAAIKGPNEIVEGGVYQFYFAGDGVLSGPPYEFEWDIWWDAPNSQWLSLTATGDTASVAVDPLTYDDFILRVGITDADGNTGLMYKNVTNSIPPATTDSLPEFQ